MSSSKPEWEENLWDLEDQGSEFAMAWKALTTSSFLPQGIQEEALALGALNQDLLCSGLSWFPWLGFAGASAMDGSDFPAAGSAVPSGSALGTFPEKEEW